MNFQVILGISGSIAAYKAIDLAKALIENSFDVEVVLSKSASEFISLMTLKSLFPGKVHEYNATLGTFHEMLHISLAKSAGCILIAPASANIIAKLASGSADCLLSTICLATDAPIILAPAMNTVMWRNAFVQHNIECVTKNNIQIIGPATGLQACGDFGEGRMLEVEEIVEYMKMLNIPKLLTGKKVVITCGPTREKIDPVRFLSNYSSGKMGYSLAKVAMQMGANVTLISGPTSIAKPLCSRVIDVESAEEMFEAAKNNTYDADIFIGAAAVADYKSETYNQHKIKKTGDLLSLNLVQNIDIITNIKTLFPKIFCVGFCAETNDLKSHGYKKLNEKKLDIVAINDVSDNKVFGKDHNELHIITKQGEYKYIERNTKDHVAKELLQLIVSNI